MPPIFLTGAGGFIGSTLCETLLNNGYQVIALLRYTSSSNHGWLSTTAKNNNLKIVHADIADQQFLEENIPHGSIVINLAALIGIPYSYKAVDSYLHTNIIGAHSLLRASIKNQALHFIQTSTSEIYGTAQYTPIDERHPHVAQSPYAASKIAADQLALSFYRSFDLPVTILRPFNAYGPRQSPRAFIPSVINQILDKNSTSIKVGSLYPKRDLNFVKDTAHGYLSVLCNLDKCIGKEINIASSFTVSMQQVVDGLIQISGTSKQIEIDSQRLRPSNSEVDVLYGCNSLIRELTNWTPSYGGLDGFTRGLEETYDWFKTNIDRYHLDSTTYFL